MTVTKWRYYLVRYHFIIRTDHQFLKYLLDQKLTTILQHKWLTKKLLGLDYKIQYKKGTENLATDALSRRAVVEKKETKQVGSCLALIATKPASTSRSYKQDSTCQELIA